MALQLGRQPATLDQHHRRRTPPSRQLQRLHAAAAARTRTPPAVVVRAAADQQQPQQVDASVQVTAVELDAVISSAPTASATTSATAPPGGADGGSKQEIKQGAARAAGDMEEEVWRKASAAITVFSAQQYVQNYLTQPLHDAGFTNLHFVEVRQRL